MAVELTSITPRGSRRLRLVFSNTLDTGAFGTPAPSAYVVDNEDGRGPSPAVVAALVVGGSANNVELALDGDLVQGALYRVTALGVPATDASTSTSASDQQFRFGVAPEQADREPRSSDADLLLYGRDIVWTGDDYLEDADGDLATLSGIANAQSALRRRLLGAPLVWAPGYSPRAREYVDIPLSGMGTLRGRIEAQALADDRVKAVRVTMIIDDDTPEDSYFEITPTFAGGGSPESIPVGISI